jgi:hypothetical protein
MRSGRPHLAQGVAYPIHRPRPGGHGMAQPGLGLEVSLSGFAAGRDLARETERPWHDEFLPSVLPK